MTSSPHARSGDVPDVTVVVIAYNDAANLPTAVRSVTRQTLRNLEVVIVDDASTDATGQVADQLAASDPRVRAIHLEHNSGGCSTPRNVGIARSHGRYIMFLDSDDELDRHACKNLWATAESTGADMVSGRAVRYNKTRMRTGGWFDDLYTERVVLDTILDRPEQLYDTICTNKLYRRDFIEDNELRFPEGLHYEDLLFTTEAYCTASRIAIIPNRVYVWNVVEDAENLSITNRRLDLGNWQHRITVHQRIDEYLDRHHVGRHLHIAKDTKFLNHDLKLFMRDLPRYPLEQRRALFDLVRDYLLTIDPAARESAELPSRLVAFFVMVDDLPRTLIAAEFYLTKQVPSDVVAQGDRLYWTAAHLDREDGRRVLDVTERGYHVMPFSNLPFSNVVTSLRLRGSTLVVQAEVLDLLGRLAEVHESLDLSVAVIGRLAGERWSAPVTESRFADGVLHYTAEIDLGEIGRRLLPTDRVLRLQLRIFNGVETDELNFTVREVSLDGLRVRFRSRFAVVLGDVMECSIVNNALSLTMTASHPALLKAGAVVRRAQRSAPGRVLRRVAGLRNGPAVRRATYRALQRLPIRRGTVVFESHMGRQYSDSPRYIYEELVRSGAAWTAIWSYAESASGFPKGAKLVKRNTVRWLHDLARAEVWVDNQGFPRDISKRHGTTYIQTWHGTPLKTMGFDEPRMKASPDARAALQRMVDRWDYFVVPSEYTADKLVPAFGFKGEVLRVGYPRNDLLVTAADDAHKAKFKDQLGIPPERRVVLYAPTFRDNRRRMRLPFQMMLDLDELSALADDHTILVRTHYLERWKLPDKYKHFVRDVSAHHDITEVLLATDVLVTDYSSVMFDWANTGRPVIFFAYDYDDYRQDQRGTYFDLLAEAPGPVVSTTAEIARWLADPERHEREYGERLAHFRARYSGYDSGKASEAIVERFFTRGGR